MGIKRFGLAALIAGALMLATTVAASASSHGAMPAGLNFVQKANWEIEHYVIHMTLTYQAIQAGISSPKLGWFLLNAQTLCARQGDLTSHLFDTAEHALGTFIDSLLLALLIGVESFMWIGRFTITAMRRIQLRTAGT